MADKLPTILNDYLFETGQASHMPLSESHLLAEAEWQLYQCGQEGSAAYEAHPMQKKALRSYVMRLRNKGVVPKHDFEL